MSVLPQVSLSDLGVYAAIPCGFVTLFNTFSGYRVSRATTLPPSGGALFGGAFTLGAIAAYAVDCATGATDSLGRSDLARITRLAIYIIVGAALGMATVSLAGFSITVADAAIITGVTIVSEIVGAAFGALGILCS